MLQMHLAFDRGLLSINADYGTLLTIPNTLGVDYDIIYYRLFWSMLHRDSAGDDIIQKLIGK